MANTKIPIELSSTPGIVDNSTTTAITIDGAGAATFSGSVTMDRLNVETGTASNAGTLISTDPTILFSMVDSGGSSQFRNVNGAYSIRTGGDAGATTGTTQRALFAANGDISFYEDTGTTPKLFWDSSAESLGIGTSAAGTLHGVSYGTTKLHIDGGTDRGQIIVEGDSLASIVMSDNGATANSRVFITQVNDGLMLFKSINDNGTSKATIMTMTSAGNVGVGTSLPTTELHIRATQPTLLLQADDGSSADILFGDATDGSRGKIEYTSNDNMVFQVNNLAEAMRLDASGNLSTTGEASFGGNVSLAGAGTGNRYVALLGETNTYAGTFILQAGGGSATYGGGLTMFGHSHATRPGSVIVGISSGSSGVFAVNSVGIVGGSGSDVLTVSAAGNLSLTGTITAPAIYNSFGGSPNMYIRSDGLIMRAGSSLRYKNTVVDATHGLAELLTLRPVTYKSNSEGDLIYGGLIAEEVYAAGLPEFVQYGQDGEPDGLSYGNMVSLCIKAIQEQQAIIQEQQAIITAVTTRLEALEGA